MQSGNPDHRASVVTAGPTAYSWYALGILFLVYVFNFIDRQLITILAPGIKRDLGLNDADIGFLYGTAFAVFYALFGIPLGRLADSWKRVRLLTIGLALWSAMTALSGFARNGAMLAAARAGVGIGEATASPSAYSLLSDLFPPRMRATAIAIYSAGAYFGAGISLMLGGYVVEAWDNAHPDGGAFGLVGWQIAFMVVGLPGVLLAMWVATLREPVRGLMDGMPTPAPARPFRKFGEELCATIPPLTLLGAARRGRNALAINLLVALLLFVIAFALIQLTGATLQWMCVGIGYYAVFSWASSLRSRDRPTFRFIWRSPAFLSTVLSYGVVSFMIYGIIGFAPVYALETLGASAASVGFSLGGGHAASGFLGVILGGRLSDWAYRRHPAGRIFVIGLALLAAVVPIWLAFHIRPEGGGASDFVSFVIWISIANVFLSATIGGVAATTQELVLPRMRGTATATLVLSTTMVGLALGPYLVGQMSVMTGSLATAATTTLWLVPLGLALLCVAWRTVPAEIASVAERARSMGEVV